MDLDKTHKAAWVSTTCLKIMINSRTKIIYSHNNLGKTRRLINFKTLKIMEAHKAVNKTLEIMIDLINYVGMEREPTANFQTANFSIRMILDIIKIKCQIIITRVVVFKTARQFKKLTQLVGILNLKEFVSE